MDIYAVTSQELLERISKHCPESLATYLQCINRADEEGTVYFTKEVVDIDMSEDFRSFRNHIKKLARENILEWHPFNNGISVTLAGFNDN